MLRVCGRSMNGPPKVSTSRSLEYVTLHGKRDFAGLSNNLEVGKLTWITQKGCVTQGPYKRETRLERKGDVGMGGG